MNVVSERNISVIEAEKGVVELVGKEATEVIEVP